MKLIILSIFMSVSLFAQEKDTCYTVQLVSKYNSAKNIELLNAQMYPENCRLMSIGKSVTVRCGCYDIYKEANKELEHLQLDYKDASLATTYKYRFSNDSNLTQKTANPATIQEPLKKIQTQKKIQEKRVAIEDKKATCYTVQLVSRYKSQESLEQINTKQYPQNCQMMSIGNSLTVRCGCYDRYKDAKVSFGILKQNYDKAAIAKTYKYRFNENNDTGSVNLSENTYAKNNKVNTRSVRQSDEELRLILNVYLYKTDLENAYKVASMGYERYPNSYYWNEQMANISKWTNRSARSMKHLKNMYSMRYSKEIEDELIKYGSEAYQYEEIEPLVLSRVTHNPSEKNIDHMIMIYKKIGAPEKVIAILEKEYEKNPKNKMFLTKGLALSLELSDLDLAKTFVDRIQESKPYKKKDAVLMAKYFYVQQEMELAYEHLSYADENDMMDEDYSIKYYELSSDLGWYLQKNQKAAEASHYLMDHNKARLADYERISFVYRDSNPKLASLAMRRAYREYKISYLFYSYANEAIESKNFEELRAFIDEIDETNSMLVNDAMYWIIKSNVYEYYNETELERLSLEKAIETSPENYQIKLMLLNYFMRIHNPKELRAMLTGMADSEGLDYAYYLPMASAYFYLSDINRASYYVQELLNIDSKTTKAYDFKFLQAYIYQIQNNEGAFKSTMKEIVNDLKVEAKKNPKLKEQDNYLSNYLRAAIYVLNPDKFEKKLKKAKPYLSKKNYDEISYSWAVQNNAYEKSLKVYNKMDERDIWIQFSNEIIFQNHSKIENLLDSYLYSLSMGDASQETEKDGQIALSQSFTYDGFSKNDANQNAYIHHRDLSKIRSDALDVKTSYYDRDPLLQKILKVNNRSYIGNELYLVGNVEYFLNETLGKAVLLNVPNNTLEAALGIEKIFDRGSIAANFNYYDSMETYYGGSIFGKYRFSTDLLGEIKIAKNENALESTQLLIGGKKDFLELRMTWNFLNSTSLNILYEKTDFSSQDEVDLGSGDFINVSLIRQIRNGYPDLRIGIFGDYGVYNETSGSKGVIDNIQAQDFPVLPADFYNLGVTFSYGMANADDYTRVWRPYIELYPYYNSEQDNYTYGLNIGYGGKVWHQDHLILGASYSEPVGGNGGRIFEFFLDYHFMYAHP